MKHDHQISDREIEAEIFRLVQEITNVSTSRMTPETDLKDLGVDGDAAVELLVALKMRYGVDVSAFKFGDHFGTEGWDPCRAIDDLLRGTAGRLKPLRLGRVVAAVRLGILR